jgi:hypothetical protein
VCAGTLLSREQYLHDVEQLGYVDGRLTPASTMQPGDVAIWTEAIPGRAAAATSGTNATTGPLAAGPLVTDLPAPEPVTPS